MTTACTVESGGLALEGATHRAAIGVNRPLRDAGIWTALLATKWKAVSGRGASTCGADESRSNQQSTWRSPCQTRREAQSGDQHHLPSHVLGTRLGELLRPGVWSIDTVVRQLQKGRRMRAACFLLAVSPLAAWILKTEHLHSSSSASSVSAAVLSV